MFWFVLDTNVVVEMDVISYVEATAIGMDKIHENHKIRSNDCKNNLMIGG